MDLILFIAACAGIAIAAILVLERVIVFAIACCAPILPSDFVGPDGILLDTKHRRGVFDRRTVR